MTYTLSPLYQDVTPGMTRDTVVTPTDKALALSTAGAGATLDTPVKVTLHVAMKHLPSLVCPACGHDTLDVNLVQGATILYGCTQCGMKYTAAYALHVSVDVYTEPDDPLQRTLDELGYDPDGRDNQPALAGHLKSTVLQQASGRSTGQLAGGLRFEVETGPTAGMSGGGPDRAYVARLMLMRGRKDAKGQIIQAAYGRTIVHALAALARDLYALRMEEATS